MNSGTSAMFLEPDSDPGLRTLLVAHVPSLTKWFHAMDEVGGRFVVVGQADGESFGYCGADLCAMLDAVDAIHASLGSVDPRPTTWLVAAGEEAAKRVYAHIRAFNATTDRVLQ